MRRFRNLFKRDQSSQPDQKSSPALKPDDHPAPALPSPSPPSHKPLSPAQPQTSSFFTKLSPELRSLIYTYLFQSTYLTTRRHIVYHGSVSESRHFCLAPCLLPAWSCEDELQAEIGRMTDRGGKVETEWVRRLQSPWVNHWTCGEGLSERLGREDVVSGRVTTAFGSCWGDEEGTEQQKDGVLMSMLLVCKAMSAECLDSIYRSTTFIFTDAMTYQLLAGFCQLPPGWDTNPSVVSPAFREQVRRIELCLPANFAANVPCSDPRQDGVRTGERHDGLNFHWLQLDQFTNLMSLKIWIASRDAAFVSDPGKAPVLRAPILVDLDAEALAAALQGLKSVGNVEVSAALHESIKTANDEEDGWVGGVGLGEHVRVWKRGTGDRYHGWPGTINEGGIGDGVLLSSSTRVVKEFKQARQEEHVNYRPVIQV